MPSIDELIREHVTLEVECIDRLYLNGYVPKLQTGGQLVTFLMEHLKQPIPSPALLGQLTGRFVASIKKYVEEKQIPLIKFAHGERKDDIANDLRRKSEVEDGVVFVGVAQEKALAFSAKKKEKKGYVGFDYSRGKSVYVNQYYFYLNDAEFGPAFIKVCSYAPWGIKICLNGHEWAKRQLEKRGIGYEALDNGFLTCEKPSELQAICDSLGPKQIERFFRKWVNRLPMPLGPTNRKAGYDWQLSIWQMEVSLTQVFDRPVHGREFFEEVIRDNLDLGRPDRVQLIFDRFQVNCPRLILSTDRSFSFCILHVDLPRLLPLLFCYTSRPIKRPSIVGLCSVTIIVKFTSLITFSRTLVLCQNLQNIAGQIYYCFELPLIAESPKERCICSF